MKQSKFDDSLQYHILVENNRVKKEEANRQLIDKNNEEESEVREELHALRRTGAQFQAYRAALHTGAPFSHR